MKRLATASVTGLLAVAACGGDDDERSAATTTATPQATATATATPTAETATPAPAERKGTKIVLAGSQFGSMLFNSKKQAIYIFENDPKNRTVCVDECAEAWPPVFTKGKPVAGDGVKVSLLGTIERPDGGRQVTYAGKPLYYYAHEGPGQVLCHNVHLNGGLWWVVAPSGKRRA
jgi:predicted lipoprotein with Yx(FWY)xxD motif